MAIEQKPDVKLMEDEIYDFLTSSPTLEQIIDFHISEPAQLRTRYLLEVNREGVLTPEENTELDDIETLEHFMIMLKIRARMKLTGSK